jgi:hypothetical protein
MDDIIKKAMKKNGIDDDQEEFIRDCHELTIAISKAINKHYLDKNVSKVSCSAIMGALGSIISRIALDSDMNKEEFENYFKITVNHFYKEK